MCCFLSGGFGWDLCIIPSLLLTLSALLCVKNCTANPYTTIISAVMAILSIISLALTYGDTQSAIYEAQKIILFITAFYIAGAIITKQFLIKALSYLSAVTSVIGLLAYLNFLNFGEFVFWDMYIPRLQSVIKYANTTALFLSIGYIASLTAYKIYGKKIYTLLCAVTVSGLYLTISKAMIPIFILVGTLYIFYEKDLKGVFISQNITTAIFSIFIVLFASRHIYFLCFAFMLISILISYNCPFKNKNHIFKLWLYLLSAALIVGVLIIVLKFEKLTTFTGRLLYAKDALKLIFKKPIFGCGQGSWQYLQYQVQLQRLYFSSDT